MSYANICHKATGNKLVILDGVCMTEHASKVIQRGQGGDSVHWQQLRATDSVIQIQQRKAPTEATSTSLGKDGPSTSVLSEKQAAGAAEPKRHESNRHEPKRHEPRRNEPKRNEPQRNEQMSSHKIKSVTLPEKPQTFLAWLLRPPAELRTTILEHVLGTATTQRVFLNGNRHSSPTGPTMFSLAEAAHGVNDQLFGETLVLGFKRTIIEVHSGPGNTKLQAWLADQDLSGMGEGMTNGFDAVHTLEFRFPHRNPRITSKMDIGLMVKCKNLKHVTIDFDEHELHYPVPEALPAVVLRERYRLDEILKLQNLRYLKIQVPFYLGLYEVWGVRELAVWFKKEFKKLGMEVDVWAGGWQAPKSE